MITVEQATNIILSHQIDFGTETISIERSHGRVLRTSVRADRDLPPFNRSTRDGIAINYKAFEQGTKSFLVEGLAAAGSAQQKLSSVTACLEIMTGAALPLGTDTIIQYEDVIIENDVAHLKVEAIGKGQNVHYQGSDRVKASTLIAAGQRIGAAEIGVAASVGCTHLEVSRTPQVAIITTGDELVDIEEIPLAYQIRKSNNYQLSAALQGLNIRTDFFHLKDDLKKVTQTLAQVINDYDVLILSGGVSKGKFDFVPKAMEDLKVENHFHKVKQRPGKPMWFGTHAVHRATIFALPGNPVSSFMCLQRYLLPWLRQSLGLKTSTAQCAILQSDIHFQPNLTYFAQVRTATNEKGQFCAYPVEGNGSGDFANLVDANGFLELPIGKNRYKAGSVFRFWRYAV
ncbi:MAG: molybdopterin molybdotransferase MoeA [Bacteroidota bacterium]